MFLAATLMISIAAASSPARAKVPSDVPFAPLLELSRQGEVMLLPEHNRQPFNGVIVSRAYESCERVAARMMDVERWHEVWNIKEAIVIERTPTRVKYEMQLDMILVPRIPGIIERPTPDKVIFNDVQTGAQFIFTLDDVAGGCALRYSMLETPGKASGWVAAVRTLEESTVDAANFAAGLSSTRGFAKPEQRNASLSPEAEGAFAALAQHGTAMRVIRLRAFPTVIARRVIDRPVDEVLWAIRDKKRWVEKVDVLSRIKDRGLEASYTVGAFGGRVSFDTKVQETGDAHTAEGLTITERVVGGDIKSGRWVWRIKPVPGGTDVELLWDTDIAAGSSVMTALADTDPIARESLALHLALTLMGDVVGGKPLGQRNLAKVP